MKEKILQFLYDQVKTNKISQIKKGMVEELEAFVQQLMAEQEASKIAQRMSDKTLRESKTETDV